MCARAGRADGKTEEEGQELAQKCYVWVVRMHKLNYEESRQGAWSCVGQESLIEKTAFPVLNGDQENWIDRQMVPLPSG